VTIVPYQQIEVFEEGRVVRGFNPAQPNVYTEVKLNSTEQSMLEMLRTEWCQKMPQFRSLRADEPFYDLGFRCSGYEVKQTKVPVEMLPPIFSALLKRLPQLPATTP
jgi:hypothetical protein